MRAGHINGRQRHVHQCIAPSSSRSDFVCDKNRDVSSLCATNQFRTHTTGNTVICNRNPITKDRAWIGNARVVCRISYLE
jgi:hypothetical protein